MYSDAFSVKINGATINDNYVLNVLFTAHEKIDLPGLAVTDIAPSVLIGLYGYNSKDFIVSSHGRTIDDERDLEWTVGAVGDSNVRFTTVEAADGRFRVLVDLSAWADKIDAGIIKRAEIAVRPVLKNAEGTTVALNAPSRTFDLVANAFDDDYYAPIVDVANCNACHDALATSFHSADRGGNVKVCRICHVGLSGGSHLEMQSRSIDSYVHAIHSFQAFDPGDIDFTNLTESMEYDLHIEHSFPNFTLLNCEACHVPGAYYSPPDQSKSMPGKLSGSDMNDTWDRNIGDIPSYVTGPASRACGACHRSQFINEDLAGELASFNAHTDAFGTLIEDDDGVLDEVIETIMSMFN
jgi:OmcA/MtrC family decaheme c-type cytochrome